MDRGKAGVTAPGYRRLQLSFFAGAGGHGAAIATGEFFDAAGSVDELLFASEKRVASGADTNFDIPASRAGVIDRAAGAANLGLEILGMNVRFHGEKESPQ